MLADRAGDSGFSRTLAKGLVVLEAFIDGAGRLGNQEISARIGIPRPTVARLTHTLSEFGYLRYDHRRAQYYLGARALCLAYPIFRRLGFLQAARPLMAELAARVEGTVSVALLDGTAMIHVESACSPLAGPRPAEAGMPVPIINTALGQAATVVLPAWEAEWLEARLEADDPALWSRHAGSYRNGVRQCLERGFCVSYGDYRTSLYEVAAPLFHAKQWHQAFAVNCALPVFKLRSGQLEADIGPRVKALAVRIGGMVDERFLSG